jgi:hypothetical protein
LIVPYAMGFTLAHVIFMTACNTAGWGMLVLQDRLIAKQA